MHDPDPQGATQAWAAEILETRWAPVRYRLELERARWVKTPGLAREHYQARYRVWELAGACRSDPAAGAGLVYPADPERLAELAARAAPTQDPRLAAAALERARVALGGTPRLRARGEVHEPARRGVTRYVVVERSEEDAQLVIDYDPHTERRLGYLCGPFFRGSTRSAALSKASAVRRAGQVLGLPAGAELTRARVVKGAWGRVWRLRWDVDTPRLVGAITASLNARSGSVCVYFNTVCPRPALLDGELPTLERAAREIARAARAELGAGAVVGEPVRAAVEAEGAAPRAAWVAVVRGPDRRIYRARLDGARVALELSA